MKIIRYVLNAFSASSTILLLLTLILWGRSYLVGDFFNSQHHGIAQVWSSGAGRLTYGLYVTSPDNGYDHGWTWDRISPGGHGPLAGGTYWDHERFGIGWGVRGRIAGRPQPGFIHFNISGRESWISYWLVTLIAAPASMILLRRIIPMLFRRLQLGMEHRRARMRGFPLDI